jgi:chemotaxis signal transduction protein
LVDAVSEILTVGGDEVKEAPKLKAGSINHLVRGVISNGESMTRVVDLDVLLAEQSHVNDAA